MMRRLLGCEYKEGLERKKTAGMSPLGWRAHAVRWHMPARGCRGRAEPTAVVSPPLRLSHCFLENLKEALAEAARLNDAVQSV